MNSFTYRIIIEPDGKEFHGYVPALPGCHTHGKTIEITRKHLREAMSIYLSYMQEKHVVPIERGLESFETISVPAYA